MEHRTLLSLALCSLLSLFAACAAPQPQGTEPGVAMRGEGSSGEPNTGPKVGRSVEPLDGGPLDGGEVPPSDTSSNPPVPTTAEGDPAATDDPKPEDTAERLD